MTSLVVSVHDVAPASATPTGIWLDALDRRGLRSSLLVIPGRWRGDSLADRAAFQRLLRERQGAGDEIVQHGWRHQAGVDACGWRAVAARSLARGAGEFAALSQPAALLRLRAGHAVLADAGLATAAFTAPGWLHSPGTLRALRQLRFTHTTTHTAVVDLVSGQQPRGFAFSHRPGGAGERAAAHLLRAGVRATARAGGLVRIALHPDDLSRPGLRDATLAAIDEALDLGAAPATYGELLASAAVS
jgi:predicted deacetylase